MEQPNHAANSNVNIGKTVHIYIGPVAIGVYGCFFVGLRSSFDKKIEAMFSTSILVPNSARHDFVE